MARSSGMLGTWRGGGRSVDAHLGASGRGAKLGQDEKTKRTKPTKGVKNRVERF